MERKSINVRKNTWEELQKLKSPGQSFDGIVQELIQNSEQPLQVEA